MSSTLILITGANTGIGFATVKILTSSSSNYHVIVAGRSLQKAEEAVKTLQADTSTKGTLSAIQLDVTDEASINAAAATVQEKYGKLDVLVNNAGVANSDPDTKTKYNTCFSTNVIGPMMVSAAFRPLLLKSQNPYTIYVSSVVGSVALAADPTAPTYRGPPGGEAYRASKAALNMAVLQEIVLLGDAPLKIFVMCPGMVRSGLAGHGEAGKARNKVAGDPEDPAKVVLSIVSGARDADVGKFIHKDGLYPW